MAKDDKSDSEIKSASDRKGWRDQLKDALSKGSAEDNRTKAAEAASAPLKQERDRQDRERAGKTKDGQEREPGGAPSAEKAGTDFSKGIRAFALQASVAMKGGVGGQGVEKVREIGVRNTGKDSAADNADAKGKDANGKDAKSNAAFQPAYAQGKANASFSIGKDGDQMAIGNSQPSRSATGRSQNLDNANRSVETIKPANRSDDANAATLSANMNRQPNDRQSSDRPFTTEPRATPADLQRNSRGLDDRSASRSGRSLA